MKLRQLLIAAFAFGAAAAGLELGVRWFVLDDGLYRGRVLAPFGRLDARHRELSTARLEFLERGGVGPFVRAFDPELGWTNVPGTPRNGGGETIDSIGARGSREYAPEPAAGVLRLVAYGDSFVFGSEVEDSECWPAQLEAIEPRIEAINLGVPAYGTDQALLRFRREGRHGAQVVAIGIMLENICRNVNRYRPMYAPEEGLPAVKPRFVLREGELVLVPVPFATERELIESALAGEVRARTREHEYWAGAEPLLASSAASRLLTTWRAHRRRRYWRYYESEELEPFRVTLAVLERFHEEALASGAERALVLVFGKRADVQRLDQGRPYWDPLLRALEERRIPTLDLASELHAHALDPRLFEQAHLSPTGNRLVAERLRRWLAQ